MRRIISKKIRFEVFKRDKFTCQYCGSKAPDVILEIDHIKPISKQGDSEIMNLITSCFNCNRGKSDRELSDDSTLTKQRNQLDELQERKNQIEMMLEWKYEIDNKNIELKSIESYISKLTDEKYSLSEIGRKNFRTYLKKYGFEKLIDAINLANEKYPLDEFLNKVGGILFYTNADEKTKTIGHIKNICRKNFYYFKEKTASIMLNKYFDLFTDYEESIEYTRKCKNWSEWYNGMINYIEENKDKVL